MMTRFAESEQRDAKIAELKRLITAGKYESLEKLEDAVDAFLWSEQDRRQTAQFDEAQLDDTQLEDSQLEAAGEIQRSHPK